MPGSEKIGSSAAPNLVRVIDYETTGLPESAAAEVIELARIDVDLGTGAICNGWRSFARPRGTIPPDVKAVHHTLETQLSEAKSAADAAAGEVAKLQDAGKALTAELADAKSKAESVAAEMAQAVEQKTQEATALQAKVTELEAALAAAKAASGSAQ